MPPKVQDDPSSADDSREEIERALKACKRAFKLEMKQSETKRAKEIQVTMAEWQKETQAKIDSLFDNVRDRVLESLKLKEEDQNEEPGTSTARAKARATAGKVGGKKAQAKKGKVPANPRDSDSESPLVGDVEDAGEGSEMSSREKRFNERKRKRGD